MVFLVALGPIVFAGFLILLMARYSPHPAVERARAADERARLAGTLAPAIPYNDFRMLVIDLLEVLGFTVSLEHHSGREIDILARCHEPLRSGKYIVHAIVAPPGDVVDQPSVVRLSDAVRAEGAAKGILFTPYAIESTGLGSLDVDIELIDGKKLRELVEKYLPKQLDAIDGYKGF